ncbi:hypothetical protein IMSAGC013_04081 [Lachnospiraceae bacterium]|nr:hypothetical protein IMSAGC013_04081 [Lachnospiraceae bacterium]
MTDDFPPGCETFSLAEYGHFRLFILAGGKQNRQKPGDHQFIDFPLSIFQFTEADALFCGNNGVMIRHFLIIHKRFITLYRRFQQLRADRPINSAPACPDPLRQRFHKILGQIPGIGSGVSYHFIMFIEALHIIQSLLGGKAIEPVGVLLQRSQIIQKGRVRLLLFFLHILHHAGAVSHFIADSGNFLPGIGGCVILPGSPLKPDSVSLYLQAVIGLGFKSPNLGLPPGNNGKGRRLYSAAGKLRIMLDRKGTGGIKPH